MSWFSRSSTPLAPEWKTYQEHFKTSFGRRTPLNEVRFVVLDLETTGLDVKKDRMLSLGAMVVQAQEIRVAERLEYFIHQPQYQPNQSVNIHGIMPQQNANGITEEMAIKHLLSFLQQSVIVGHHIGFDIAILNQATKRIYGKALLNKVIDTRVLAERVQGLRLGENPREVFTLDQVCQTFNIRLHERHTAAGDTLLTALLFLKLMGRLQKRGVNTLGQLRRS